MPPIRVGEQAPEFSAETHDGGGVSLQDYCGKRVLVLFFYPRDATPVCTTEACAFRDAYEQFVEAGAEVVGVSSDSAEKHRRFAAERRLPFKLISDAGGSLRKAFGVPKTWGLFPGRVTYVIDQLGIVRMVFNSQWNAAEHITNALRMVRSLQANPA